MSTTFKQLEIGARFFLLVGPFAKTALFEKIDRSDLWNAKWVATGKTCHIDGDDPVDPEEAMP